VLTTFVTGALKLAAALAVLAFALWLTSLAMDAGLPLRNAIDGSSATWPTAMPPGALALACSAVFRQRGKVQGIAIGALIGMYALDVVSRPVDRLEWLKYLSAFHYYGAAIEHGIWWWGALVQLIVIAALVPAAVWLFERRDVFA
jgi:ABC-2 type transport system permease protein